MSFVYLLDLIGTFTFAVSGALMAARKNFDMFGALFIGFMTAVGGGTVRDTILGNTPVFWLLDYSYLLLTVVAVLLTSLFARYILRLQNVFLVLDAIGIGVFTEIGIRKALAFDIMAPMAIILGVMTAVMGGMIRDVFSHEEPLILRKEVYATACLAGGGVFFLLKALHAAENLITAVTILTVILIRLVSIRYKLSIPRISL